MDRAINSLVSDYLKHLETMKFSELAFSFCQQFIEKPFNFYSEAVVLSIFMPFPY
ncbi:hypothetical protein SAMN03097699_0283 [Flavobacteriaceae bacterium MAR_2010_188]|nr:hypothetical protein SAMN03097699_0283 [Flavobacteriaceae bacterium MAR_2010_188]